MENSQIDITVKSADFSHVIFLWYLRNCPEVYRYYRIPRPVSWEEYIFWVTPILLHIAPRRLYIIEYKDKTSIGSIWFQLNGDSSAKVTVEVMKEWWRKGYGTAALAHAIKLLYAECGVVRITSEVNIHNESSRRLTEKFGFTEVKREGDWIYFELAII